MNGDLVSTTTIRQRGQLTIPKKIREKTDWLSDGAIVEILSSLQEVKIVPYKESAKVIDWEAIWERIKLARRFKGKRGNLSSFIFKDRTSH
ncbi:hypothetical protein COT64_00810 [Candidatus Shapirobacteria bacterium CG09_land_8_20_14_0_10_39_12]|uniref:SpoVT-AbrB domain-containing protein n=1 Tax=Candidatus Shapirobacteria bacterium CG09_land_8_20_14_0_10_39_12 TaxID=1974885 RepID=A0A2H0WQ37_9BACT|nr:MAG: hypothetical protein COT64_00810 [Candidatus Shapirobacteria bacterium CG09_land_8_20_14_0_10_39_12]